MSRVDNRAGADIGSAVRAQAEKTRQALQQPHRGAYRGRPVEAASGDSGGALGWNPVLMCWDKTGGIGGPLQLANLQTKDTADYIEATDESTFTQITNVNDDVVWVSSTIVVDWPSGGAGSYRGITVTGVTAAGPTTWSEQVPYDGTDDVRLSLTVVCPLTEGTAGTPGSLTAALAPSGESVTSAVWTTHVLNVGEGDFEYLIPPI